MKLLSRVSISILLFSASVLGPFVGWGQGGARGSGVAPNGQPLPQNQPPPLAQPQGLQLHINSDSVKVIKPYVFQPNPKRAGLLSAIVPGLGQVYNRQYWKLSLVYVGLGVAGYFIEDNYVNYQQYRKAYIGRINNNYPSDKYVNIYSTDQLRQLQDDYNKYLNMSVLFTGIAYTLQVLDAITAAHLKNFDISRDLSLRVLPVATPYGLGIGMAIGLK